MNKLIALTAVAALAIPAAAFAQSTTGTVTITGTVAAKCSVTGASTDSYAFAVDLAEADGSLEADIAGTSAAAPAFTKNFTVDCTSANAQVSVASTALDNEDVTSAPTGYSQTINYTGRAVVDIADSATPLTVDDDSSVAAATSSLLGSGAYLANTSDNLRISAYAFSAGGNNLIAGDYSGQIVVTIAP